MATKKGHVLPRDGSAQLGGPRPPQPERPAKGPKEASTGLELFPASYGDRSYVGVREERAAFEKARGNPNPRQTAQQGGDPGGTHTEPGQEASIGLANPLE